MRKLFTAGTLSAVCTALLSTTAFAAGGTESMPLGDRVSTALQMILIGMLLIFSVLTTLMCVLMLFKRFFYTIPQRKAAAAKEAMPAAPQVTALPAAQPLPLAETASAADGEVDPAVVAAITGAITAYFAAECPEVSGFRVVSFRKASGSTPWNAKQIELRT